MTTECHYLRDGRQLQNRRGRWVLLPDETGVEVRVEGREAIVTDQDGRTFTAEIIDQAETMAKKRAAKKPPGKSPEGKGTSVSERWDLLNTFTRDSMPMLGEAAIKVWLRLFTDTKRDGIAWAGGTYLATATGLTRRGVVKAVKELRGRGLVKLVHRGSVNGQPNGYRVTGRGRLGNRGSLP